MPSTANRPSPVAGGAVAAGRTRRDGGGDPPAADPGDLLAHWRQPTLLLSQTCGYPLVTQLPEVQTVGCFHYAAPGCEGRRYRSLLVVREADSHRMLGDFLAVGRCAMPSTRSPATTYCVKWSRRSPGRGVFSAVMFSGSHRQSLRELQQENADIAAIDCVTYALLQRHQPQALAGLVAIGWSPAAPWLPLITAGATPAATLNSLREALQQLVSDDRYRSLCDALLICGYSDMSREAYAPLLAWRDEAAALGVSQL